MTIIELILKNKWEDVSKRFIELYSSQEENIDCYEYVFCILPTIDLKDSKGMRLCISHVDNIDLFPEEDEAYEDVHGKDGSPRKDFNDEIILDESGSTIEESYALELSEWGFWVGLPIDEATLKNYGEIDIICHVLWEMTFFGFDQDKITEVKDDLDKRVQDIKDGTAKLIPWEEFKKEIEDGFKNEEESV